MMKLCRIYTEEKNVDAVKEEVSSCFKSFSVFTGMGVWQKTDEPCMVIEIITAQPEYPLVKTLARSIKHLNNQDCVMISSQDTDIEII